MQDLQKSRREQLTGLKQFVNQPGHVIRLVILWNTDHTPEFAIPGALTEEDILWFRCGAPNTTIILVPKFKPHFYNKVNLFPLYLISPHGFLLL